MSQKRQKRVNDLPATGTPNSTQEKKDPTGTIIQRRSYGADARATLNIGYQLKTVKCGASRRILPLNFFAFRGKPAGDPHAHDWDWNLTPPRQQARSLFTGELEIYESQL